uniref:Uncharacterized protein n=1 Tax=uncultured Armatimonadetes bacterium TaxID=157466 RepID=A0A6J4K137_9BACT|nr:hypothetical protein AVDCRST_MAG63-4535 [uncultured Armatimonadetes bacterium]
MPVPDTTDLARLPLWAAVAFAARCARRVQPLFEAGWPQTAKFRRARAEQAAALERAIAVAERFAAQAAGEPGYSAAADADHAVDAQTAAGQFAADKAITAYADAAAGAAYAADVAADLTAGAAWARREDVYDLAARAVRGAASHPPTQADIRQDFERLVGAAQGQEWDDRTPVPATFFGT